MIAPVTSFPPPETDLAWTAATERVKSYLRAHGVTGSRQVSRLAADVIGIAQARHRPGVDPTALAMETLEACMTAWLARLLPADDASQPNLLTRGRVALTLGEVPARWPEYFLRDGATPAELVRVMRETGVARAPEIRLSHMAPPKLAANPAAWVWWQAPYRWPLQRLAMAWRMVAALIGAAFTGGL